MTQTAKGAQGKFHDRVREAFNRHRKIRNVSVLARTIARPRTSVSRAINQDVFPRLQNQIARALKL